MADLKELVQDTLRKKGVLGKFKAQLKHAVISVIEEQDPAAVVAPTDLMSTEHGQLAAKIVQEFTAFHNLQYTNSVFCSEASMDTADSPEALRRQLGLAPSDTSILVQLLRKLTVSQQPPEDNDGHYNDEFEQESNASFTRNTDSVHPQAEIDNDAELSDAAFSDVTATEDDMQQVGKRYNQVETLRTIDTEALHPDSDEDD
eukprot:TRINITY_DN7_c0_g2_i1.p1 TRINITY_DN7_c0_g2~~TRINITY_DN7_c0_g2_i1.p1  ORF type:complete len:202 (-),score=37.74 TRINITY_DN7_c0_g2_i1:26-631(-)